MSYSNLIFNNSEEEPVLGVQNTAIGNPRTPPVIVTYNNTQIHTITGPVPKITISHSTSNDSNDLPEYIRTTIQLEGKIVKMVPTSGAFSGVMAAMSGLQNTFTACPMSDLIITCDSNILFHASGSILKDLNFQPSNDNWTKTADYSITLESLSVIPYGNKSYSSGPKSVTNKVDRWSVEQIDDIFFTDTSISMAGRSEYEWSNPILNSPPPNINSSSSSISSSSSTLGIKTIPQFRVTHTVSAKGLPIYPTSTTTYENAPDGSVVTTTSLEHAPCSTNSLTQMCVKNAREWVTTQINLGATSGYMPYLNMPNAQFYNHIRSVNIDLSTYEITDTWLAMNENIPYIDNYTIESSIDENMVKTVRVVGNIVGLHPVSSSGIKNDLLINIEPGKPLTPYVKKPDGSAITYNKLDSEIITTTTSEPSPGNTLPTFTTTSAGTQGSILTTSNKYGHALAGWTHDIKPYLYRRACLVINTHDRTIDYINATNITSAPANHIYAKDRLLSPIPYSITEGHDPRKGTISYSAEYRNSFKIISGVISENIDISYDVPRDEVATIAVPGRALGPILSRTGRSASRKTININVVVLPPRNLSEAYLNQTTCPLYTGGFIYTTIKNIIQANRPGGISYVQSDNESWSPSQGRYSRSVQWIYQGCSISTNYITGN